MVRASLFVRRRFERQLRIEPSRLDAGKRVLLDICRIDILRMGAGGSLQGFRGTGLITSIFSAPIERHLSPSSCARCQVLTVSLGTIWQLLLASGLAGSDTRVLFTVGCRSSLYSRVDLINLLSELQSPPLTTIAVHFDS